MSCYGVNYDALHQIHIDCARRQRLTGKDVCVAILDTGIGPHMDFGWEKGRVRAFYDSVNGKKLPYDDNSHGSHIAGIIGSSGRNPKGEIIGGSQREDDFDKLERRMKDLKMTIQDYWWYLDLRKYGSAPHSGFGLGLERILLYITGIGNIRDVALYPRTKGNLEF